MFVILRLEFNPSPQPSPAGEGEYFLSLMPYEVEKRSKLSDQMEFDRVKNYLEGQAEFLGRKEMKSFLFRTPTFLRIRLVRGDDKVLITEKTGEYTEAGRLETEYKIPLETLPEFVNKKAKEGYQSCSLVHTTRNSYLLNGLKVELNTIDHLGLIIEIEALTENETEVPSLESEIGKTMVELQLKELDPKKYQEMMTAMYSETLKPVSEHDFRILASDKFYGRMEGKL